MWKRLLRTVAVIAIMVFVAVAALLARCAAQRIPQQTPEPPSAPIAQSTEPPPTKVVNSHLAGSWYEADPAKLNTDLEYYLDQAKTALKERDFTATNVQALILPHAGYRYSGPTAAYGAAVVAERTFTQVIVMGPSHSLPLNNKIGVTDATHYRTPLGEVPIALEFTAELRKHPEFVFTADVDRREHSVQIEIPLLQKSIGSFRLVPLLVGQLDLATARRVAEILTSLMDTDTLVVASSDFTHYGPNYNYVPFKDDLPNRIKELDMGAFADIEKKDPETFVNYLQKTGATICGEWPIAILLYMLPAESTVTLLHYAASGEQMGYTNSVSYLSAAALGSWPQNATSALSAGRNQETDAALTSEDKTQLLILARKTLAYYLENKKIPSPHDLGIELTPPMESPGAAFVTINKNHQLRGCIGETEAVRPLYESVMGNAINAGLRDPRFPPVTRNELDQTEFEISVLTPARPVESSQDIVLGKHGIILSKQGRRALFLPQVATEQGWDLNATLSHLAQKAGLPQDAWKSGATFQVFEAIVFHEESHNEKGN